MRHPLNPIQKATATILAWLLLAAVATPAHAVRIKDIANIEGTRTNQLVGYGLVVGLDGTGDGNGMKFTHQSLVTMLEAMGITINLKEIDKVKNVAAVMITAELPPFATPGNRLDVQVSSLGDAKSLQSGMLLLSPLKAADGNVYAVAQGPVSTGSFSAQGQGSSVQKNFPTVGRVVNGAVVERALAADFQDRETLTLSLREPDFTTVSRMAEAINTAMADRLAHAANAGTVEVAVPRRYAGKMVDLVTLIETLDIKPDVEAKVVINERTGTVVMGENVRLNTVAIAHGNLSIEIKETAKVSQPMPFSQGKTTSTPETSIAVKEESSKLMLVEPGVSIGEVVGALNALGVTPRDLIAIFQAIKAAGALNAKLEIL